MQTSESPNPMLPRLLEENVIEEVQLYSIKKASKRSLRKSKPRKAIKRSWKKKGTLKRRIKPKATQIKKLKKELWELCKQITRKRYGTTCYTCGATGLSGGNQHTAHFIARSVCGLYLRYDLRNLRVCCYRCNVSLAGNGANFYRNLVEREGQQYVDGIFADKTRDTKATIEFFAEKVAEYKAILESVNNQTQDTEPVLS